jgi:hypothetical protein
LNVPDDLREIMPWRHDFDELGPRVYRGPYFDGVHAFRVANVIDAVMACNLLNGYTLAMHTEGLGDVDPFLVLLGFLERRFSGESLDH